MKINFINKKNIIFLLYFVIIFFVSKENVFAADTTELWSLIVTVVQWFLKIVSWMIWLITALVSLFLYPWWVNWELFNLDIYLRTIWVLVSNIVYYIFAFILIFIAFMNIIWTEAAQKYELKQSLPKFIIWVLMVPFSWFFVQFVLSISSFLTVAVLTIPFDTFQWYDFFKELEKDSTPVCVEYTINLWDITPWEEDKWFFRCQNKDWWDWKELTIFELLNWTWEDWEDWIKNSIFWIVSIYTYWVISVDWLDTIANEDLTVAWWLWSLFSLWIKVIFDIIFIAMYLILLVALFLALFVRATYLWLYTMLSPAFWLLFFFWKAKEWIWWSDKKFSITEFISLAMVPVLASAALSFWLMLIFIVWHGLAETQTQENDEISIWWFTINITWSHWTYDWPLWKAIWWVKSTIWQIILEMFWLAILWIAVIAALSHSSVTRAVIEPIASFWTSVWKLVAKSPTYMPIPWTGALNGWKWISAVGLWTMARNISSNIESRAMQPWADFAGNLTWKGWMWEINVKVKELSDRYWVDENTRQYLKRTIESANGNHNDLFKSDFKWWLEEFRKVNPTLIDSNLNFNKEDDFAKAIDQLHHAFKDVNWWDIWVGWEARNKNDIINFAALWEALKWKNPTWNTSAPSWNPPSAWTTTKTTTIWSVWWITINENWSDTIIQPWWKTKQLAESFDLKSDTDILNLLNAASITEKAEIDQSLVNILNSWQDLYSDWTNFSKIQKPWYTQVTSITFDETNKKLIVT